MALPGTRFPANPFHTFTFSFMALDLQNYNVVTSPRRATKPSATWSVAMVAAGIVFLYFAREVLIPFAFAVTLSFMLTSPVVWMQKRGLGRVTAVLIATMLTLSAAVGTSWIVGTQLLAVINDLPRYRLNIHNKLESIRTQQKGALGRAAESIDVLEREMSPPAPSSTPALNQARPEGKQAAKAPTEVQVVQRKDTFQYFYDFLQPALRILGT